MGAEFGTILIDGYPGEQIVEIGPDPVGIFNYGPDTLWISRSIATNVNNISSNAVPLYANASRIFSAAFPVYGACQTGQSATISVEPGAVSLSDIGNLQAPSAIESETIGSGGNATLISVKLNANGLLVWSASISSVLVSPSGGVPSAFTADDVLQTGDSVMQFASAEVGLPQLASTDPPIVCTNADSKPLFGLMVPAGKSIQLVNGGSGGTAALHRCSGTISYTLL